MNKFYNLTDLSSLIESDLFVQIYGCPYFLEIDEQINNIIVDKFVWDSPFNIIAFTNSIEYAADLVQKLQFHLKYLDIEYTYDKKNYIISDSNSKLKVKLLNKKDDIKAESKFYDLCLIHFCEDKIENVFDKICQISKKIVFLTQDDEKSIYYSLNEFDNFFRLCSNYSNEKIDEFNKSEVIDEKAKQLVEGKFN